MTEVIDLTEDDSSEDETTHSNEVENVRPIVLTDSPPNSKKPTAKSSIAKEKVCGSPLKRPLVLPKSISPLKIKKRETKTVLEYQEKELEASEENTNPNPYYWRIVNEMIYHTLSDSYEGKLITQPLRAKLIHFTQLSEQAKQLSMRLYLRKHFWLRKRSLKYPEFSDNLEGLIEELEKAGVVSQASDRLEFIELITLLKAPELQNVASKFKLSKRGSEDVRQQLIKLSKQKCAFTSQSQLKEKIRKECLPYTQDCFKVTDSFVKSLNIVLFVYTLFTPHLLGPDVFAASSVVYQILNSCKNPLVVIQRDVELFRSLEDFQIYYKLAVLINDINILMTNKDYAQSLKLILRAYKLNSGRVKTETADDAEVVPGYLKRYSVDHLLDKLSALEVECHCKLKGFAVAAKCLERILDQKRGTIRRLGDRYDKLALIYDAHLYERAMCIETLRKAFKENLTAQSKLSLAERAHRLLRRLPTKSKPIKEFEGPEKEKKSKPVCWDCAFVDSKCCQVLEEYDVSKLPELTIFACSAPHFSASQRSRFIYRSKNDNSTLLCSVEEYVLAHLKDQNGYKFGTHKEGAIFEALFFAIMADIVFSNDVKNVFFSPYQTRPLDWMTQDFAKNRKALIEKRYEEMASEVKQREIVQQNFDTFASSVNLSMFADVEDLLKLLNSFQLPQIVSIFDKILKDCSFSGMPDLTLWGAVEGFDAEHGVPQRRVLLCEVKGPGDQLSHKQIVWLHFLKSIEVDAKVVRVTSTQNELR